MPLPPSISDHDANRSKSETDHHELVRITNPDVQVTLPEPQYGYRTAKATWDELVQIIEVEQEIPKLCRSRIQQHDYEVFRYHMKEQYRSILDYILISKFGFDRVAFSPPREDGSPERKWRADPCLSDVETPRVVLVENDFPYFVRDSIVHYVLWKIKEPLAPQEILEAREELRSSHRALEILQWTNPPNLQSIPEIDHVHFLCRFETTPCDR